MRHVPHLYLPQPWVPNVLSIDDGVMHHMERVLRLGPGVPVTYTDGAGKLGRGSLVTGGILRGDETTVAAPAPLLTVAVAPPKSRERQRFLVEKLTELGVARLVWLTSRRGEGRPPKSAKAISWAVAALQQSRRCHLMAIEGPVPPSHVPGRGARWVADAAGVAVGEAQAADPLVLLIGPEGGFDQEELDPDWLRIRLSDGILRVETAATTGAAVLLAPRSE